MKNLNLFLLVVLFSFLAQASYIIPNAAVTTAKLATNAVTTVKITDANVTRAKLVSVGQQISSSSGSFTGTSNSFTDVTNLSVTITTTGRPVMIFLISEGINAQSYLGCQTSTTNTPASLFRITRDGTEISSVQLGITSTGAATTFWGNNIPPGAVSFLDPTGAGTYNYKLQYQSNATSTTTSVIKVKLVAYEL